MTVLLGDGSGGFTAAPGSPFAAGTDPDSVAVGGLQRGWRPGPRYFDLNDNAITVLLGNGSGGFTAAPDSPFGSGSKSAVRSGGGLQRGRLSGPCRGKCPKQPTSRCCWETAPADSRRPRAARSQWGNYPTSVAVGDFNGDGIQDLLANDAGGTVTVLLGDGAGGFTAAAGSPFAVGSNSGFRGGGRLQRGWHSGSGRGKPSPTS